MPDPVLSVSGLSTSLWTHGAWKSVVRDLAFDIGQGETLALVGESGSGKSITALSVMRLLAQGTSRVTGTALLDGLDLLRLPETDMLRVRGNKMAMVFQEPMTSLNPSMTIGRQIAEGLSWHRGLAGSAALAQAVRLLEKVQIPGARARVNDYPHQFSGGMRQRVMIAMALACEPRLLIADEPTTALDVTIQAEILSLIRQLQDDEQTAVLFITHDMGVVAEIAQRVIVMRHGQSVEMGVTTDIFDRPCHPYTRSLLASIPRLGSMAGYALPTPFTEIDPGTGAAREAATAHDTVDRGGTTALSVRHLSTHFDIRPGFFGRLAGRVRAVEDVSFAVLPGETLAIVGESGSGKSTIARSIVRLVQSSCGEVLIDGKDALKLRGNALQQLRRHVQMIFQDPFASLDPRMTIGDAIAEPLLAHSLGDAAAVRAKVADLLTRVGLAPAMAGRHPHEFSGGQRQRICIARALALEPKLIIADEAVSSLDVSVKAQIINLLLELQSSMGIAYLFISHDMAVVERVAHRVAVMYRGEIVEIGARAAVFGNPQHPYTRRLMAAVPIADPRREARRLPVHAAVTPFEQVPAFSAPASRPMIEVSPDHMVQQWA